MLFSVPMVELMRLARETALGSDAFYALLVHRAVVLRLNFERGSHFPSATSSPLLADEARATVTQPSHNSPMLSQHGGWCVECWRYVVECFCHHHYATLVTDFLAFAACLRLTPSTRLILPITF